ncbi:MAG: mycothiol synthase [Actinobacteria bacterium]|nr:mycothiol synthase [Actinomycetota bacterium]
MRPSDTPTSEFARRHDGFVDGAGGVASAWITCPPDRAAAIAAEAAAAGLRQTRTLFQLRTPLPVAKRPTAPSIKTRPFIAERDVDTWVAVNNAAFAWHPDQGHQSAADLLAQMAEPWFDAAGFRVLELDGVMAGFCWTKIHDDEQPPLGEIYVIATAPEFAGRGLGLALTIDGLDYLHDVRGITQAMLYVEADNGPALRTYERIGFTHHLTRLAFVEATAAAETPLP